MRHPDEGTIHAWLDGALAPDDARAVETHVTACEACAARVAEARGLAAGAARIVGLLDGGTAGGGGVGAGSRAPRRRPWVVVRRRELAAAAVLLVAGGVVGNRVLGARRSALGERPRVAAAAAPVVSTTPAPAAAPAAPRAEERVARAPVSRSAPATARAAAPAPPAVPSVRAMPKQAYAAAAARSGAEGITAHAADAAAGAGAVPFAAPATLALVRQGEQVEEGRLVRRVVYAVPGSDTVTLTVSSPIPEPPASQRLATQRVAVPRATADRPTAVEATRSDLAPAPAPAPAPVPPVRTITWADSSGSVYTLTGPFTVQQLESLRARLPLIAPPATTPRPPR